MRPTGGILVKFSTNMVIKMAPADYRFSVLSLILIKSGTCALQIWCLIFHTHQIWHLRIADLVSYSGYSSVWHPRVSNFVSYLSYSSNLTPADWRSGVLFRILIKSGTRTLQFWCLILETNQIWHLRIVEWLSYFGYSSNLACAHCRVVVLFWILIKSSIHALNIWCLILDTHQVWHLHVEELVSYLEYSSIWHPRIADLVSYLSYSSNLAPADCRSGVLFWILIKSGTCTLQFWCLIL